MGLPNYLDNEMERFTEFSNNFTFFFFVNLISVIEDRRFIQKRCKGRENVADVYFVRVLNEKNLKYIDYNLLYIQLLIYEYLCTVCILIITLSKFFLFHLVTNNYVYNMKFIYRISGISE